MKLYIRLMIKAVALLVLCFVIPVAGNADSADDSLKYNSNYLSSVRIVTKVADSGLIAGYLTGISGDTVTIGSRKGESRYSLWDLSYIKINEQKRRGPAVFFSSLAGIYYGYLLAYHADGNPAIFYAANDEDNSLTEMFATVIFGGVGVIIGYLMKSDPNIDFPIRQNDRSVREVAEDLERILKRRGQTPRCHISFSGGFVYPKISNDTEGSLNDAGAVVYDFESYYWNNGKKIQNATGLNMVRRIAISYNLNNNYDVGAALVNAGEPVLIGGDYSGWLFKQEFKSTNFYLTGSRYILNNRKQRLYGGIGVGLMLLNFEFYSEKYDMDIRDYIVYSDKIKKTRLSAYLYTGFEIMLDEYRSIGVGLDYVIGPSFHINGNPEIGYNGQDHRFGNGSITVSMGIHLK